MRIGKRTRREEWSYRRDKGKRELGEVVKFFEHAYRKGKAAIVRDGFESGTWAGRKGME